MSELGRKKNYWKENRTNPCSWHGCILCLHQRRCKLIRPLLQRTSSTMIDVLDIDNTISIRFCDWNVREKAKPFPIHCLGQTIKALVNVK